MGAVKAIIVDETLNFAHPLLREARDYWKASCGGRGMPRRADFDPLSIHSMLPHAWLADVMRKEGAELDFYIRVAGYHIENVFGSLSRKLISETLPPDSAERWRYTLGATVKACKPLRFISRIVFQQKDYLIAESFIVPLSDDDNTVLQLLGIFVTWSERSPPPGLTKHEPV